MSIRRKFLLVLFLGCNYLMGQSITSDVIGNAGVFFQAGSGSNLHWTIGEVAVQRYQQNDFILTEGFHQSYTDLFITSIWELPDMEFDFSLFPNPTTDLLTLTSTALEKFDLLLINAQGQPLIRSAMENGSGNLHLGNYPSGIYWVSIFHEGQLLQSFKILKTMNR